MLVAGAILAVAPHTLWLPFWADFAAAALLIWRAIASIRAGVLPRRWLLILLTFSGDRKSTRLNSSHLGISYAVFCLKKKKKFPCSSAQSNTHCDLRT